MLVAPVIAIRASPDSHLMLIQIFASAKYRRQNHRETRKNIDQRNTIDLLAVFTSGQRKHSESQHADQPHDDCSGLKYRAKG